MAQFTSVARSSPRSPYLPVLFILLVSPATCQYSGGRPLQPGSREVFTVPPPGDPNYKTYFYNNRRYGQGLPPRQFIPSYNDPNHPNPNSYDPNINRGLPPGEDRDIYMYNEVITVHLVLIGNYSEGKP